MLVDLPRSMPYEEALREFFASDAKRIMREVCGARAVYIRQCVVFLKSR